MVRPSPVRGRRRPDLGLPASALIRRRQTYLAARDIWCSAYPSGTLGVVDEPVATHEDVTTIMALLGDIYDETKRIRWLLEEDDGEPEAEEDDLDE